MVSASPIVSRIHPNQQVDSVIKRIAERLSQDDAVGWSFVYADIDFNFCSLSNGGNGLKYEPELTFDLKEILAPETSSPRTYFLESDCSSELVKDLNGFVGELHHLLAPFFKASKMISVVILVNRGGTFCRMRNGYFNHGHQPHLEFLYQIPWIASVLA
jgi:hypothetical protein